MGDTDKALEKTEQGNAWDENDEVVHVEVKKPLDKVIPVALSLREVLLWKDEASSTGTGRIRFGFYVSNEGLEVASFCTTNQD